MIDIAAEEDTLVNHCSPLVSSPQKKSPPSNELPLSATPKRPRFDLGFTYNMRQEPRRTWKDDPLPQGSISGYGAMHRKRMLTDVEWMKVLASDNIRDRLADKTPEKWQNLMGKLRVGSLQYSQTVCQSFIFKQTGS